MNHRKKLRRFLFLAMMGCLVFAGCLGNQTAKNGEQFNSELFSDEGIFKGYSNHHLVFQGSSKDFFGNHKNSKKLVFALQDKSSLGFQKAITVSSQEEMNEMPIVYPWDEGIEYLVLEIMKQFPLEQTVPLAVGNFRDAETGKVNERSLMLKKDFASTLEYVEGVRLIKKKMPIEEPATGDTQDLFPIYVLSGVYRIDANKLRINAVLTEDSSNRLISSGEVVIHAKKIERDALEALGRERGAGEIGERENEFLIDKILSIKKENFDVSLDVWTDKKTYQVGEKISFYFRSNRDGYLTLIDVGTSGGLRVLFPNRFHSDSFVKANQTYEIPDKDSGFHIRVEGPTGLERIKAILTEEALSLFDKKDLAEYFYSFPSAIDQRTRDLRIISDHLERKAGGEDYLEIYIIDREFKLPSDGRKRTIKPKPPKKPIDIIGVPGQKPEKDQLAEDQFPSFPSERTEKNK